MSASHKSRPAHGGGRPFAPPSKDRTAHGKPASSSEKKFDKKKMQWTSTPHAHTVDTDYTESLQQQLAKEKKSSHSDTQIITASKKKVKKVTSASDADGDADMEESISEADIKKAMASAMKDGDDDDNSKSSSSKSTKSPSSSSSSKKSASHKNAKIKPFEGESDEAYKLRLKAELRKRKHEKKKLVRAPTVASEMAARHEEALKRRAEKQRLHLERQAKERAAKAERLAREKALAEEKGLTNKQLRLLKEKKDADDAAAAAASASSSSKKKETNLSAQPATSDKSKSDPKPTTTKSTPPAQTSTTQSKSSKPSLVPANPNAPLPKHHDWEPYNLHPAILRALLIDLKFTTPTAIQQEVLLPAIRDWKDISAAATTGSGKTLAFGIPIVHRLLTLQDAPGWTDPQKMQALILTPTRELALQIVQHLEAIARYASPSIGVAGIVGGISEDKQKRILEKKHPAIVVATPGRLWELIDEAQLTHFSSAYYLRFLVLDEADRMIDTGHFAELERILNFIETHSTYESVQRNQVYKKAVEVFDGFEMLSDEDEEKKEDEKEGDASAEEPEEEEDEDVSEAAKKAVAALQGNKKGKASSSAAKSTKKSNSNDIDWDSFLTEEQIFAKLGRKVPKETSFVEEAKEESEDEEEAGEDEENEEEDEEMEMDEDEEMPEVEEDEEEEADEKEAEEEKEESSDADADGDAVMTDATTAASPSTKTLRRQVFLFSATLMLPTTGREDASKTKHSSQKKRREPETVLEKLANKITFQKGEPFIVDLSTTHQVASTLQEVRAECVTEDKDYLTYYFLLLYPGKTLVFVNSISCLRRLVNILTALKLNVLGLHAEMQQKARLKSLERFKSVENSILICTDVAARGLDIPQVPYIIHYQLPRTAEIYIHRSGRVARAGAEGLSCAIVDEKDSKNYRRLCLVLKKVNGIPALPIDQGFMTQIRARMNVARQLDQILHTTKKESTKRDWFLKQAEAMEMEVDEDELQIANEDENGAQEKEAIKKANLQKELDFLLTKPLMHGTLNRKFYTLNVARGFDINKESAKIAHAGSDALIEKNGMIRVGAAQNVAVGMPQATGKKLPSMLKKAREGELTLKPTTTEPTTTTPAVAAATPIKVVTSLSAKRKEPEPNTSTKKKGTTNGTNKKDATAAAAENVKSEPTSAPPTKKQKTTNKK